LTLLELTVVILVLLSLVALLFIGGSAWKKGSDRALCITNLEQVQKGVRGYCNLYGYDPGDIVAGLETKVIGPGKFVENPPDCPGGGAYSYLGDQAPVIGTLYVTCSLAASEQHEPSDASDW
jgi:hypothetical protein